MSSGRSFAGAISTTFWCLRCTEQSRSNRWTTFPSLSPRIWTSMCRGFSTYFSRNTVPSPKAFSASARATPNSRSNSCSDRTTRIPRPPPPIAALMITGYPASRAKALASSTVRTGPSDPGTTGTPVRMARLRAVVLSANMRRLSTVGPTKVTPASAHACAKSAFSERKPYPGCTASTPLAVAMDTMVGISRYWATAVLVRSSMKD
mmetsp:Transcript_11200/g.35660  ORF Transcript_11200/g.35660 Transcript_11200/m.35660 type:complete len:206 (+) Transcript_11200:1648-2265(+)